MKTGKKIAVALAAALAIAIFAGGAVSMVGADVSEEVVVTVTVSGLQVHLEPLETDYGSMMIGDDKTIEVLRIDNPGTIPALVDGAFSTKVESTKVEPVYGLIDGTEAEVIPGDKFELNGVAFRIDGASVDLAPVAAAGATTYNGKLSVSTDLADGNYSGTIVITIMPDIPEE